MIGEIIAIGDELTSGRVLNTTSRFAADRLFGAGHDIIAMATIGDTPAEIKKTLLQAMTRADFIIVTGGLGATSDDLTTEAVAEALGQPTQFRPEIFARIKARYPQTDAAALEGMKKLAVLPAGAEPLNPEARMAGYLLVHATKPIFFLPGVPHEMQELLVDKVIPRLDLWRQGGARLIKRTVYRVFGLAETEINRRVSRLEDDGLHQVRLGYYPVFPEVHLSLVIMGNEDATVAGTFIRLDKEVKKALGDELFGTDDDTIASVVGELLQRQGKWLATAESCTGGLIGSKITSVPGSSNYYAGGVIAYSNTLKEKLLNVDARLLARHGAVSPPVAKAMAEGARDQTGADLGVAVTGIAGPAGGSPEKPVGTVFIGLATANETICLPCHFTGKRWQIQELTAFSALDLIRRFLQGRKTTKF